MGRLSIRWKLTLLVAVMTALVGVLAVGLGLRAFEGQIRGSVVERNVAELEAVANDFAASDDFFIDLEELTEGEFDLDELTDVFGVELSEGELAEIIDFELGFEKELVDDLQRVLITSIDAELVDELFEYFADDDGAISVLMFDGRVVRVPASITNLTVVDDVEGLTLIPQNYLFELEATSFGSGSESLYGVSFEPVEREIDGQNYGLLVDASDELAALDEIRPSLWTAAALFTLLAAAATWFFTGRALRPVAAITDEVEQITSGTLDGRVPEPAVDDEIGVLARTMNAMLGRLERSDMQRRQFVSDASHELRTPVAVLRSEAEVARRAPDSTSVPAFAEVVMGEAVRLEGLVEDLLALARSDERRGPGARTAAPIDLDVDDIVLAEAARTRRLPVDRSAVSAGRVVGRPDDLSRVIAHLLDNAARHGSTQVAVGVKTVDGRVQIWVDDDGEGVPEADRLRVFERFVRLDDARTRDRGGSGLGLAVVNETVTALGGTVAVVDSPLGGSRFVIDLPSG